jgi:lipoprotein-anchoring transpeptidase ErfK/SrfK
LLLGIFSSTIEDVAKKSKKQNKLRYLYLAIIPLLLFGVYLYKNILPYKFPAQWEPTAQTLNTTGKYDYSDEEGVFLGQKVRSHDIPEETIKPVAVLGENNSEKRIEVDLTNQRVYAYEGEKKVMDFLVSTGKWGKTPTGEFTIAYKNYVQKMEGGKKELNTYYYLPNVHYVQFFGNKEIHWGRGFSFHEAYWHNNFGVPMSHGCVNMRLEDSQALYNWTTPTMGDKRWMKASDENPGTRVVIYGEAPGV